MSKSLPESLPTPRVVASSKRLLSRRAVQKNDERAFLSFFYLPFFSLQSYLLTDHEEASIAAKRARSSYKKKEYGGVSVFCFLKILSLDTCHSSIRALKS